MSILSTNHRLIKVGQDYSAGENIDIHDHVISSKDWMSDIQAASANAYEAATAIIPEPQDLTYMSGVIDYKLDASSFVPNDFYPMTGNPSGFLTAHQDLSNYYTTGEANALSSMFSGAIDYVSANAGDHEVSNVVQSNSSTWNTVSDKLDASAIGIRFGVNDVVSSISGLYISAWTAGNAGFAGRAAQDGNGDSIRTSYAKVSALNDKLDATAFSTVSGDFLTAAPADMATTGDVAELAQTVSETYQVKGDYLVRSDSANFYPANNPSSFTTEDWVTAQGYITGVDLSEYAKTNDVLDDINSAVSGKLDTTSFSTVSGNFLTAVDLSPYYTTAEANTLSSMLSGAIDYVSANAGDEFPASANEAIEAYQTNSGTYLTAHQIIPSAKWEDASDCVQTNSAQWAQGGGSPSGFVSGSNVLFVPNEYIPGQGKVYSANISGDITVNYGEYYNSGENINIYATYSLSSVGSQIGDKLNKSVIEDSKTLSIIDDKAEVYSFAYRPSELVTTGITVDNYSSPNSVSINTRTQDPYKLYSASLVIESDGFNYDMIPDNWVFVNSANGSATFSRFYKDQNYDNISFQGFWDFNLTNASAYSVAYSGFVIDALAFKSDLTGQGGGVPQSAFDELKASYNALSASYASLSSLFATYSGQWLLPNEGV